MPRYLITVIFICFSFTSFADSFKLEGTWHLLSIEREYPENHWKSDCETPNGTIIYTAEGTMAAGVNCKGASDTTIYMGTYLYHNNQVVHFVKYANNPDDIGKELARKVEILNNGHMYLIVDGRDGKKVRLKWERELNG